MQETKSKDECVAAERQPLVSIMSNIAMNMSAEPVTAKATGKAKATSKPKAVSKTAASSAKTSKKRTFADTEEPTITVDESDFDDPRFQLMTEDCNAIRRKINTFIDNGGMEVGAFQAAIQTTSGSYNLFMKQTGRDSFSHVYQNAAIFFKKRELANLPMPRKKAKPAAAKMQYDVADIHLEGEETDDVPLFDTCDDVRRKISAHLRGEDVTQAAFLKAAASCFTAPRKLQRKQLEEFLGKKGPTAGNTSGVYYASYVLFEKMRIKAGKEKSKKRVEMEEIWGDEGGIDKKRVSSKIGYICGPNVRPVENQYGQVTTMRFR